MTNAFPPLHLALEPILPTRTPGDGERFEYGFTLRLPGGPQLAYGDPLLAAYGARLCPVAIPSSDDEAVQDSAFDPGSFVRVLAEPPCADDEVSVWDLDGLRQAGTLPERSAAITAAALEQGLEQVALILSEERTADEDRREALDVLIFSPTLLHLDLSAAAHFARPERPTRRRLVLVVDPSGGVHWWDPTGTTGPIPADELPMSDALAGSLNELCEAYAGLGSQGDGELNGFERIEAAMDRHEVDARAAGLWRRARVELGRRYAIGFLGANMQRPVWSPEELREEDDEDGGEAVPF